MIKDFSEGKIYDSCKNCVCLIKGYWGSHVRPISSITFNHFMACNLKCTHCGYRKEMETTKLVDTKHEDVLNIVQKLVENKITLPNLLFDVGGGEPSISKGLLSLMFYGNQSNLFVFSICE